MSGSNNRKEGERWLSTSLSDLDAAEIMLKNKKYNYCCFLSQQGAEKALKALIFYLDGDPWGHSIVKLLSVIKEINPELDIYEKFLQNGRVLDRYYIATRYPDSLPDITPAEAYGEEDALSAYTHAAELINEIKIIIS